MLKTNESLVLMIGSLSDRNADCQIFVIKEIETTFGSQTLQQLRWPPTNSRIVLRRPCHVSLRASWRTVQGSEFSWKWEVAPGGMGLVTGSALGPQFQGDLFMGAATSALEGGYLFHFNLTGNRNKIAVDDPCLADRVADNLAKHEITESESLLISRNFGVITDIETGPNGNLFVVTLSNGTVYEIFQP